MLHCAKGSSGHTVANGKDAAHFDTPFVHARAENHTVPIKEEKLWNPNVSNVRATSVGVAAYANTGMDNTLDNIDMIGNV